MNSASAATPAVSTAAGQDVSSSRAAWMGGGGYGVMVHYIPASTLPAEGEHITDLNTLVDAFDLAGFVSDFDATGAEWLIFTIGQNTGQYLSPSTLIDQWAGPGHTCRRDLIGEIATAVHARGKRFIAYLPCEVAANTTVHKAFDWTTASGTDQAAFQLKYTQVIAEWARRWGDRLDGWWFDGCYTWDHLHNSKMHWPLWYAAARAGNADAVVTFNDGSFCVERLEPIRPEHDYLAGEAEELTAEGIRLGRGPEPKFHRPTAQFINGTTQWHALLPIDAFWAHGGFTKEATAFLPHHQHLYAIVENTHAFPMELPVYSDEVLGGFLRACRVVHAAVTLNVGIYENGRLGEQTLAQLARIRSAQPADSPAV